MMMIRSSAPKRQQRQLVLILLLSLFAIVRLRQDMAMNLFSEYKHALVGMVDEDPGFGAMRIVAMPSVWWTRIQDSAP